MFMTTKSTICITQEESDILAKAREIIEEIADKVNKTEGEFEFEDDEDGTCIDEIARFSKDISDAIY